MFSYSIASSVLLHIPLPIHTRKLHKCQIFMLAGKECEAYKKLDEADRAMGFANQSTVKCDGESGDNLNGWYRMTGKAGDEMPEKCVPIKRCGTLVTGWLNGKHPTEEEGVVDS